MTCLRHERRSAGLPCKPADLPIFAVTLPRIGSIARRAAQADALTESRQTPIGRRASVARIDSSHKKTLAGLPREGSTALLLVLRKTEESEDRHCRRAAVQLIHSQNQFAFLAPDGSGVEHGDARRP